MANIGPTPYTDYSPYYFCQHDLHLKGVKVKIMQLFEWIGISRPTAIGVDIEPSSTIIILLNQSHKMIQLKFLSIAAVPEDAFEKGVIQNPEELAGLVQIAAHGLNLRNLHSIISTPAKLVTTFEFKLKKGMTETAQEEAVYEEAKKAFANIKLNDIYLDFAIKASEQEDSKTEDIFLVAAHKNAIQNRLDVMKHAKIPVSILDVDYFALERGYQLIKSELDKKITEQNVAILDMSSVRMLLVVYNNDSLIHFYHHSYYIDGMIQLVRYHIDNPSDNKEELKRFNLESDTLSENQQQQLINQVQYILKTFTPETYSSKIDLLIISGRTMLIPGIHAIIEKGIGGPTLTADPFKNMLKPLQKDADTLKRFSPACLLATGLAMRNIHHD